MNVNNNNNNNGMNANMNANVNNMNVCNGACNNNSQSYLELSASQDAPPQSPVASTLTSSFSFTHHAPSSPALAGLVSACGVGPSSAPGSPAPSSPGFVVGPVSAPSTPSATLPSSPSTATPVTASSAAMPMSSQLPSSGLGVSMTMHTSVLPSSAPSSPAPPQQQQQQQQQLHLPLGGSGVNVNNVGGGGGMYPMSSMGGGHAGMGGGAEPLDRCNVFVKYLPPDMRDEGLYELFAGSGRISSCKVMLDHKTHSSLGYGFVRFATADEALKAIDKMSGHQVGNKTLLCKLSNCTPAPSQAPCNNLYVKPLLTETTEEQLKSLFSVFGRVEECRVMMDKRTGRSRQIGFVRFSMLHEATAALKRMNGSRLSPDSLPLIVKYAETDAQKAVRRARKLAVQSTMAPRAPIGYFPFAHQMAMPGALYPQMAMPYFTPAMGMGMHMGYAPALTPYTAGLYAPPPQPALHTPVHAPHHAAIPTYYPQQPTYHAEGGNLFVFHLPSDIDDTRLGQLFSPFGEVESVKVISDKGTGESKGYGFVKFYRMADAMNAIAYMNGYALGSKHLKVTFKTPVMRI